VSRSPSLGTTRSMTDRYSTLTFPGSARTPSARSSHLRPSHDPVVRHPSPSPLVWRLVDQLAATRYSPGIGPIFPVQSPTQSKSANASQHHHQICCNHLQRLQANRHVRVRESDLVLENRRGEQYSGEEAVANDHRYPSVKAGVIQRSKRNASNEHVIGRQNPTRRNDRETQSSQEHRQYEPESQKPDAAFHGVNHRSAARDIRFPLLPRL
jgi:hypothetical protein